MDNPETMTIKN